MASTESREGKLYKLFEEPKHAEIYSKYRPEYPIELKQRVLSYMGENGFDATAGTSLMLDIGCGTGLVMRLFAPSFTAAWGVDISHEQVRQAVNQSAHNQFYLKSPAEVTCFKDNTFDIITAGQAWHFFDHDRFNREVSRILAPNGFLVIFGYNISFSLSPQLDKAQAILDEFYNLKLAPFYSDLAKLVHNRYRDIELPFATRHRIEDVELRIKVPLSWILDFIRTQSIYRAMNKALPGNSELEKLRKNLAVAIGGNDVRDDFNPILELSNSIFVEIAKKTD